MVAYLYDLVTDTLEQEPTLLGLWHIHPDRSSAA
jgi:hypothetical protein